MQMALRKHIYRAADRTLPFSLLGCRKLHYKVNGFAVLYCAAVEGGGEAVEEGWTCSII
jgi:hypothetical protein